MVENSNDLIAFKATRRSRWIYTPYYCAFHTRNLKFKSCLHNCVFLKSAVKRCFMNCIKKGKMADGKNSPVLIIMIQGRKLKRMHFIHRSWSTCIFTTISCTRKWRTWTSKFNIVYMLYICRSWYMLLISIYLWPSGSQGILRRRKILLSKPFFPAGPCRCYY